MPDSANNLDLALRIQADVKNATNGLKQVQAEISKTGNVAKTANTGVNSLGNALGDISKTQQAATKGARDAAGAIGDMGKSAAGAGADLGKLGNALGRVGGNVVVGNMRGAALGLRGVGTAAVSTGGAVAAVTFGIGGLATLLGAVAVAYVEATRENTRFNNALILTGGYAGRSTPQLQALAIQLDSLQGVTEHAAAGVVAQVAATGKFYGDQVDLVSRAALQMQQATGQSVDTTVQQFEALGANPVASIMRLDDTMHFLTQSVYDQITALEQQGRTEDAAAVAQQALAGAIAERTQRIAENVGLLQAAWSGLKNAAKEAWDAMLNIGRSDAGANLQMWQQQLAIARKNLALPGLDDATIRVFMQQANEAQAQIDRISGKTAADVKATSDALKAQQELAKGGQTAFQTYTQGIAHYTALYNKAIVGASETAKASALSALQVHLDALKKTYDAATRVPAGPRARTVRGPVDNSAEQLARQQAQAEGQLTDALIRQKAAVDPAAAAWMQYSVAVGKANADADAALAAHPAQAAAINATRDAQLQLANVVRDANLAQVIQQNTQAWEQLKRSFASPAELRADDALAQIEKLNKLLADGVINATEYQQSLAAIGQHAVADLPTYRGIGSSVGGAAGELQKNFQAERTLNEAYQTDLLALKDKFRGTDTAHQEAYLAAKAKLDAQYAQRSGEIEQARQRLMLDTTSELFGNLAALSSSGNKKIAAIGKAAAIAQAMIKTYQSATDAYAAMSGIPVVGPALGIAAAAAAIAAGLANVAQIRSQQVGGYAEGGAIRGPGTATSDSVPILASHGEYMQRAAAVRYYGTDFMDAVNSLRYPRFADGGAIGGPSLSALAPTIAPASASPVGLASGGSATRGAAAASPNVRVLFFTDKEALAEELLNTRAGERTVVQIAGSNPRAIQGKWQS